MTGTDLAVLSSESMARAGVDMTATGPSMTRIEEHPSWNTLARLKITLRVGVKLNQFKVRDLLTLKVGQVFESVAQETEDVPLKAGRVQLGWSEFEVVAQRMGLRLTRLG